MSVDVEKTDQSPSPQPSPRSLQRPPRKKSCASRLWDLLQPLARLWGILSAIVLSGAGAQLVVLQYDIAPVVIVGAALILILETMWVAALFVDLLCRKGDYSLSLRCWDFTRWSCGRARAPFYGCVATALLFANLTLLATVAGGMILVLAALRAAVPFSPYATHGVHSPRAGSSLLSQHDSPLPNVFYNAAQMADDRCEEMTVMTSRSNPQTDEERPVTPKPPLLEL